MSSSTVKLVTLATVTMTTYIFLALTFPSISMYGLVLTLSVYLVKGDLPLVLLHLQLSGGFKLLVYPCWMSIEIIIVVIVSNETVALLEYIKLYFSVNRRRVVSRRAVGSQIC